MHVVFKRCNYLKCCEVGAGLHMTSQGEGVGALGPMVYGDIAIAANHRLGRDTTLSTTK